MTLITVNEVQLLFGIGYVSKMYHFEDKVIPLIFFCFIYFGMTLCLMVVESFANYEFLHEGGHSSKIEIFLLLSETISTHRVQMSTWQ